jgi:hypothetical protein
VLAWAERARAACLRLDAARDPDDPELTADLARLRGLADAGVSGAAGVVGDDGERRRLERRVADRLRRSRQAVAAEASLTPAALVAAVAERTLVEYVRDGGALAAVSCPAGGPGWCGSASARRSGRGRRHRVRAAPPDPPPSPAATSTRVASLEAAAAQLDALVLGPVAAHVAERAWWSCPRPRSTGAVVGLAHPG